MQMSAARRAGTIILATLLWACGDGTPGGPDGPAAIAVSNRTSGDPIQTAGYFVRLDGEKERSLPIGESIVLANLEPGDHRLQLTGIAGGCAVSGANPRVVHTQSAETAQSLFLVTCSVPGSGRVYVQTSTYGEPDDSYLLQVNDASTLSIGTKDTLTLHGLPAGPVTLSLTHMGHCFVAGRNPRTIIVVAGQIVGSIFKVRCDLPAPPGPQPLVRRADPR
jgi:hypothetical protein